MSLRCQIIAHLEETGEAKTHEVAAAVGTTTYRVGAALTALKVQGRVVVVRKERTRHHQGPWEHVWAVSDKAL